MDGVLGALCEKTSRILCGTVRHFPKERICADGDADSQMIEDGCTLTVSCLAGACSRAALTQETGLGWGRPRGRAMAADPHRDQGRAGRQTRVAGQHGGTSAFLSCRRVSWIVWEEAALWSNAFEKCSIQCPSGTWLPHRVTGQGTSGPRASSPSACDHALLQQAVLFSKSHKGTARTRISSPSWVYKTLRSPA